MRMCRAWRHPSYRQLRRLLARLRLEERRAYRHLAARYFSSAERYVLRCPRCSHEEPAWVPWKPGLPRRNGKRLRLCPHHRHPRTVELQAQVKRVLPPWLDPRQVEIALGFLTRHFRGDPSLPEDLLAIMERRESRSNWRAEKGVVV